MKGQMKLLW